MASAEQPFDDRELRYFLAEILKVSSIAPHDLFNIIQTRGINPSWYEMALPNGRSVLACQKAYEHLRNLSRPSIEFYQPPVPYEQSTPAPKPKKKRAHPSEEYHAEGSALTADRSLQPQQSAFPSVNAPSPSGPFAFHPVSGTPPGEPLRKKRGRPSKEEFDKRVAEAAHRGETYPPPRKRKPPRTTEQGVQNNSVATLGTIGASAVIESEGSGGKKKTKKPKATPAIGPARPETVEVSLVPEYKERGLAPDAKTSATDRMKIGAEESAQIAIPETQASEFPAREGLLAGLREHAARTESETAQSSSTAIHESAPKSDLTVHYTAPNQATATE